MVPAMAGKEKSLSRSVKCIQGVLRDMRLRLKYFVLLDIPDGLTTFQHPDSFSQKSQDKFWE